MIEIQPPDRPTCWKGPTIFLGGTIDMGQGEQWQKRIISALENCPGYIFNPRRDNWDSTWEQSLENPNFEEQLQWEWDYQGWADLNIYYFAPGSKSPVTMLELGSFHHKPCIVFCPKNFWKSGNIEFVCNQFYIPLETDEKLLIKNIKNFISSYVGYY